MRSATSPLPSTACRLIVASILAKKLAAGLDALALESSAAAAPCCPEPERGRELARAMLGDGGGGGPAAFPASSPTCPEPLARSAGIPLEPREAIALLRSARRDPRLLEVTFALGAAVMTLAGSRRTSRRRAAAPAQSLAGGAAAERFSRMVASLGGPADPPESRLPISRARRSSWMFHPRGPDA